MLFSLLSSVFFFVIWVSIVCSTLRGLPLFLFTAGSSSSFFSLRGLPLPLFTTVSSSNFTFSLFFSFFAINLLYLVLLFFNIFLVLNDNALITFSTSSLLSFKYILSNFLTYFSSSKPTWFKYFIAFSTSLIDLLFFSCFISLVLLFSFFTIVSDFNLVLFFSITFLEAFLFFTATSFVLATVSFIL